jgi:hypothetical chaperone protein
MLTYAIDFGTSNSLLAAADKQVVHRPIAMDPQASDETVLRSLLFFPDQDQCFYGQDAIERYIDKNGEGRLLRSMKKYLPSLNYKGTFIEERLLRIEDMVGLFLLEMKKRADEHFQQDVQQVILGRPARFSMNPEEEKIAEYRLKKAAEYAGFQHIEFFPEPIAAAFDIRSRLKQEKTVLVVDLGGGTSDFTVIRIGPMPYKQEHLLSIGGVSVAGDVIDGLFMKNQIAPYFGSEAQYQVPLSHNILQMPPALKSALSSPADIVQMEKRQIFQFLKDVEKWVTNEDDKTRLHRLMVLVEDQLGFQVYEEIDRCKRSLSEKAVEVFDYQYPEININTEVERENYASDIQPGIEKIMQCLKDTLTQAQVSPAEVDLVHCTGGTSKLFAIRKQLETLFGSEKLSQKNEFHSVIQGLAERAKDLNG